MRPLTLADVVAEAARRAGEPVLEILWGPRTCEVRTAAGWRKVPRHPKVERVEVSIAGARFVDRPRCYEAWYEGGYEDPEESL